MPVTPVRMATRSDCAKRASPAATSNDPAIALPLRTSSQVSRSASRTPIGIWRQIDAFEDEMRVGNKESALCGKLVRLHLKIGRPGVRHHDSVFDVKFALATVIKQTERRVASLLELCDDQTRANRVNRSCRHENDVVCRHRAPYDQIRNRTIVDGLTQ